MNIIIHVNFKMDININIFIYDYDFASCCNFSSMLPHIADVEVSKHDDSWQIALCLRKQFPYNYGRHRGLLRII